MRVIALLAAALLPPVALLLGQQPTFRSAVSLVRLDVLATDRGRPIANLTSGDFEVTDNGVKQQVEAVVGKSAALDVVFTLDRSESVRGATLNNLQEAAEATLDSLRARDRAALLTFSDTVSLEASLGSSLESIKEGMRKICPEGGTTLLDAVYGALSLPRDPARRMLVLLFTDGYDTNSWLTPEAVVRAAKEADAVICSVASRSEAMQAGPEKTFLDQLSEATGGETTTVQEGRALKPAFLAVLERMRSRYLLTYYPTGVDHKPGWHELKVRLRGRPGTVTVRSGYRLPDAPVTTQPMR